MTTASGGSDVADFCVNEEGFVKMAKETLSSDVDNFVKRQYIVEMAEAGLWSLASNIFSLGSNHDRRGPSNPPSPTLGGDSFSDQTFSEAGASKIWPVDATGSGSDVILMAKPDNGT